MSLYGKVELFCPFCGKPFLHTPNRGFHSSEWGVLCSQACYDAGQMAYARMIMGQDTLRAPVIDPYDPSFEGLQ